VDVLDMAVLSANFGTPNQSGDLNGDGSVEDAEGLIWLNGF
jgi:hypothetical protein